MFFSYFLHSHFRLVHSGPGKSSPLLDSDLSFGLRSGTKQGVETHVFRVDSAKELSTWTHLLVEGCHNAAELIKEVTTGTDTEIFLTHRPSSFLLHSSSTYEQKNEILLWNTRPIQFWSGSRFDLRIDLGYWPWWRSALFDWSSGFSIKSPQQWTHTRKLYFASTKSALL